MTKTNSTPIRSTRLAAMAALGVMVAACGSLVGLPSTEPASRFTLREPPAASAERLPVVVMVAEPQSSASLDSERIALKPNDLEFQYYANARWVDRAPRMLQNHLIAALANAVTDAGTESMPLPADFRVETSLVAYEAVYGGRKTPTVQVTLDSKLFSRTPLQLLDRKRFHAEIPVGNDKLDSIMAAFDEATAAVTRDFVGWVLTGVNQPR